MLKLFQAHTNMISRIKQLPNGLVATCSHDKTAKIWDVSNISNWTLIQSYTNHTSVINDIEYINSVTIASGDTDGKLNLWLAYTGATLMTINTVSCIDSLALLNEGLKLAVGLSNGYINIYNINTGNLVSTL